MPRFMDFHADMALAPEQVVRLREKTLAGNVDQYGVRQVDLFYSPDGQGIYCLLEAPDEDAVRDHHHGNCGEVVKVESLLDQRTANAVLR
jgi:Protein of unknown function (DUF4242)